MLPQYLKVNYLSPGIEYFLPERYKDKMLDGHINDRLIYLKIPSEISRGFSGNGVQLCSLDQSHKLGLGGTYFIMELIAPELHKVDKNDIISIEDKKFQVIETNIYI